MKAADLEQLSLLITEKGWSAHDGMLRSRRDTVEEILREFLGKMKPKERELTFMLLEDYLILKDYTRPSIDLLDLICTALPEAPLMVAPVKVAGAKRVKSGDALVYEMDANQGMIGKREISFHDDPSQKEFWEGDGAKIVVDDFIGTGDQFLDMLEDLKKKGIEPKIDLLATLIIQASGKEKIEGEGIRVVSLEERPKALEHVVAKYGKDLGSVKELYLEIESVTGCSAFESMGYMASQAIVTMKKTPDNTLPIFWYEGDNQWPAPFPRKMK